MAFNNLVANQMVSEADAATAGFTLNAGQSHGTSNICMTKSTAVGKYSLLASNLSGYADNQLIPKSAWINGVVADTTPPSAPGKITGTSNYGYIEFIWQASTDNSGTIEYYQIWRNGAFYDETTTNDYVDYTNDTINRTYKICAVDVAGNVSAFSLEITKRALFNGGGAAI